MSLGEPSVTVLVEELRRKNRLIAAGAGAALLVAALATSMAFLRNGFAPAPAAAGRMEVTRDGPAPAVLTQRPSAPATGRRWVEPQSASATAASPAAVPASAVPARAAALSVASARPVPARPIRRGSEASGALDPARERQVATGYLTLDTSPWSTVTQDGNLLGQTPLIRVPLPAGEHALVLTNAELGIKIPYWVKIEPGKTLVRRVGLE